MAANKDRSDSAGITSMRLNGVTLVEVMVVVAIVMVLAGIITVVYSSSRRAARDTSCRSNLSSIGKGLLLYVTDYDYVLPPWFTSKVAHFDITGKRGPETIPDTERWRNALSGARRTT